MTDVAERLAELRRSGLYRRLRLIEGPQGPRVLLDGAEVLLLCSNNYLGLADDPAVRAAAAEAAERYGAGAGASRLISGTMTLHRRLEDRLAAFKRSEAALLFGSGYLANTGVVSSLAGRGDVVFSDELNHASIIDGCRLSRAEVFVYRHADPEHLAWGLAEAGDRARLIVTDGVFSMDGDVAPLAELADLARRHGCLLAVDEAHGTGALGPGGRGSVAAAGLEGEVDVIVGTLGKALGSYGAYVCASRELVELLINTARPFIYSTALPPPVVGAALAALARLDTRPGIVEQLRRNAAVMREALGAVGLADTDRPGPGRRRAPRDDPLRALARGRRLRPGDPAADRAGRDLAPATDGDGQPPGGGPAPRRAGDRARRHGARGRARIARRDPEGSVTAGAFVTGTGTGVGKTVVAAAIAATAAGDGATVAVFKPAVSGLDELGGAEADHRLLRRAARSEQADDEISPYRYGRPVSPHLGAELAGERIEPGRLRSGASAAAAGADMLVVEGVGGFLVPLAPDYLVRDLAVELGLPVVIAAAPGLGTINHTLLTVESVRAAGLDPALVVLTPWPDPAAELERSNRETIARLGEVEVVTLPRIDLDRPGDWPRLELPGRFSLRTPA